MTNAPGGLLAVWMEPPPESEDDFNRWYDEEHLADRISLPGFSRVRRYRCLRGEPSYLALYELAGKDALNTDEYAQARQNPTPWTKRVTGYVTKSVRREYEALSALGESPPEGAPYVLVIGLETEPEHDDELNRWYEEEHLAALQSVPGVYSARRYRALDGGSPKYLAVYEWQTADIRETDAWKKAADTPWTLQMRPRFITRTDHLGQLLKTVRK
jgi:heme-degrading monooxygenase HmoA